MSIRSFFWKVFGALKVGIGIAEKALTFAAHIATDERILTALHLVEEAAVKWGSQASRREWVVSQLMARLHLPESVARLLTELAYQMYKSQQHETNIPIPTLP